MVERDDEVLAGVVEVVDAVHLEAEQRAIDDGERIGERACRHGAADDDRDYEARDTEQHEDAGRRQACHTLQCGDDGCAPRHEPGIDHVDAGDHTGTAVRACPGLDCAKHRHDEQAARDCDPGQVYHESDAAPGFENVPIGVEASDRLSPHR